MSRIHAVRDLDQGIRRGGPRDHPCVDSRADHDGVIVDCQKQMLVQNMMTPQRLLHIETRTLQIRNEREKVI